MSPFPVNPRWYEEYWMTEQPPRLARLAAALRHLVCVWHDPDVLRCPRNGRLSGVYRK
jgi:hypothetical protein